MISETKRRILAAALGECWHEWTWIAGGGWKCRHCTIDIYGGGHYTYGQRIPKPDNRTFTSAQDYEDLLEKVVRPNVVKFVDYLYDLPGNRIIPDEVFEWFITLSIEERCKLIYDFILVNLDLFPDVQEKIGEIIGKEKV